MAYNVFKNCCERKTLKLTQLTRKTWQTVNTARWCWIRYTSYRRIDEKPQREWRDWRWWHDVSYRDCPVEAFKLYLTKLNNMLDVFFQRPLTLKFLELKSLIIRWKISAKRLTSPNFTQTIASELHRYQCLTKLEWKHVIFWP